MTTYEVQPEKLTIRCVVVLIETQHLSKVCRLHFKAHTLNTIIQYVYTISLYHSVNHTTLSFFCTKLWPAILSNDSSSGAWQWRWHIPTDRTSSTLPSPISVNDSAHYRVNGETHCRRLRCDERYSSSESEHNVDFLSVPVNTKELRRYDLICKSEGNTKLNDFFGNTCILLITALAQYFHLQH